MSEDSAPDQQMVDVPEGRCGAGDQESVASQLKTLEFQRSLFQQEREAMDGERLRLEVYQREKMAAAEEAIQFKLEAELQRERMERECSARL